MQTFDNADLAFLSILKWPQLTNWAIRQYAREQPLFGGFHYPHLNVMMREYIRCLVKAKKEGWKPTDDQIVADLTEAVESSRDLSSQDREKACLLLQRFALGEVPEKEEGSRCVQKLAKREVTRRIGTMLTTNPDFEALKKSIEQASSSVDELVEDESQNARKFLFHPFAEISTLVRNLPRLPTGINYLDQASHGGARLGELWLVAGPSGGGKSTTAVQLAVAQALMGVSTVWVTYEQTLYGDLSERMIANVTDTSLDVIRDRGFENLPENVRDSFQSAVEAVKYKLTALDMAQFTPDPADPKDDGGMYTVCREVKKLKDAGENVQVVVVDWIGVMVSRICARTGQDADRMFKSIVRQEVLKTRDFAEKNNVFFLFFHQTDTKAQDARPTFLPGMTNTREDKGMAYYFDCVFTIGRKDKHDICWFNPAKTRKANTRPITLHLVGDKARFEPVSGWVPNRDGNFYNPMMDDDSLYQYGEQAPSATTFVREVD